MSWPPIDRFYGYMICRDNIGYPMHRKQLRTNVQIEKNGHFILYTYAMQPIFGGNGETSKKGFRCFFTPHCSDACPACAWLPLLISLVFVALYSQQPASCNQQESGQETAVPQSQSAPDTTQSIQYRAWAKARKRLLCICLLFPDAATGWLLDLLLVT